MTHHLFIKNDYIVMRTVIIILRGYYSQIFPLIVTVTDVISMGGSAFNAYE